MLDFAPCMNIHPFSRAFLFLALLIALVSCSMPANNARFAQTQEVAYTAAAETVIAQLTEAAFITTPVTITLSPTAAIIQASTELPSETPSPTSTLTPTNSPTSEVVLSQISAPDDPKPQLGEPDWLDNFQDGDNWSLYEDEYVHFRVRDEVLKMTSFDAIGRDSCMLTWPEPGNYYLEVIATPGACDGLDRYGIIFRTDAEVGYLYGFSCDGQYSLRRWNGEDFKALVDWIESPHIIPGADQMNRLGLLVEDDQFSLYANGYLLEEASDDTYLDGGFGLFIASKETDNFNVQVSEVAYWEFP